MEADRVRRGALAAIVGSVVGLVYWPLHALAFFRTEDAMQGALNWDESAGDALEPLLDWSDADTVYVTYGKAFVLILFGFVLGLIALRARRRDPRGLERWGLRLGLAGGVVGVVGSVVEYWFEQVDVGFAIGAPGLIAMLVGSTLLGMGLLRSGGAPRLPAWLLALSIPLLVGTTVLLGHLSAGLIPLCLTWLLLGLWLRRPADVEPAPSAASRLE